jgi:outer membrane autotransporter protein
MNTHTTHTMPNPTLNLKLPSAAAATLPLPVLAASLPALAASLLVLSLLAAPAARAADVYWGGGTGALTDDNWFDATATKVTRTDADIINLASGTLSIISSGTVYTTNIGLAAGDSASVIMDAPGGYWNNTASNFAIGSGLDSHGSLTVLSGSVRANTVYIGDNGAGYLYLAENTALISTANNFFGRNNTATANGSGTAIVHGYWSVIGSATNNGYFILGNGTGSRNNYLEIGDHGKIEVTSRTGLAASTVYLRIGNSANSTGTMTIKSGGAFILSNTYTTASVTGIGYAAGSKGYLNIEQGGTFAITSNGASHFYIGNAVAGGNTGAYGEVNVDGYFSWNNIGTGDRFFAIGVGASTGDAVSPNATGVMNIGVTGTVNIQGASEVSIGRMGVGSSNGAATHYWNSASGTINVAGLLNTNGTQLLVGRSGDGYLNIASTGTVLAGNTRVSNGNTVNGISYGEINVAGYLGITGWLDLASNGNGYLNVASTGTVTTGADFSIGRGGTGATTNDRSGTADIYGTLRAGDEIIVGYEGSIGSPSVKTTGVLNIYTGANVSAATAVWLGRSANSTAIVNLNGGILEAPQFILGAGGANVSVTFAGGTIRAAADQIDFFQNFPILPLASGTLNLDTQSFTITATNTILGTTDARLVKLGAGSLALTANNSAYAGTVDIRAGSLDLGATGTLGGTVTIASGAAIRPTVAGGVVDDLTIAAAGALDLRNAPLTAGNLTLADGALWQFSLTGTHALDVTGTLAFSGSGAFALDRGSIDITDIPPASYTLATFSQITGAANLADWAINGVDFTALGASYTLDTISVPHTLILDITGGDIDLLRWKNGDGDWDATTTDFRRAGNPVAWNAGALAIFANDTGTDTGTVNITGLQTLFGLQFGGNTADAVNYTFAGTGTLAALANLRIDLLGAAATATINTALGGAGLSKLGPGSLVLGGTSTLTGAVTVADGSLTIAPTGDIASATLEIAPGAADTATVTIAGNWDTTNADTYIGDAGSGSLTIANGGILTTHMTYVGNTGSGSLTIENGGALKTIDGGYIVVGYSGPAATGNITVRDGGLLQASGFLAIGGMHNAAATGTLTIETGGSGVIGSAIHIGYYGSGVARVDGLLSANGSLYLGTYDDSTGNLLDIANTGTVSIAGTTYIANAANTTGHATVAGLLDVGSLLYIGNAGSGTLTIAPTGTVQNTGFAWLGYTPTGRGTVNVDGLWQSAANILVGGSLGGTGLLTIGATGTVTNPNAYIAWGEATTGTVTVRGHWNPTGGIVIANGADSAATLIVENGGTVTPSTASRIAAAAGSSGTLIIKTGGVWHSGAGINVGYAGSGSAFIHVETGGTLVMDSTTLYVSDPAGAYGEVLIDGYYRSGTGGAGVPDEPGSYYTPVGYRNGGVGVFTVGATGTAISGIIDIGRETGSSGTVTINGYWSIAATTDQSRVGNSGTGVLSIAQNGILLSAAIDADGSALNIGNTTTGLGTVNIAGLLTHTNAGLTNGNLGTGALNIASTGTILLAGHYKQNSNSTLSIALDPARPDAYITAGALSLSGTLALTGPNLDYTPVAKASELPATGVLILTATSGGIHGNFNTVTGFGGGAPDFLVPSGHVRDEGNNITTYRAGYRLSWDAPTGAHGTFTLADNETFEIDIPLADRVGETAPGWDKKSLTKRGDGTLILSGQNTFTGAITIDSGTLRLGGPAHHRYGALINNGVVDLGPPPADSEAAGILGTPPNASPAIPATSAPSSQNPQSSFRISQSAFRILEVASLSGDGAFRMTIDPAAGDGDHLIVNGDATGSHQLLITANSATGGAPQTLTLTTIAGANNTATFTGGFDYNGVNYTVTPIDAGNHGFTTNGASGITDPIHGVPGSQSLMWFASQDNLSRRLGELRATGTLPAAGYSGWLRARAEHDSLGSGSTDIRPFDMDLYGFELGADKTLAITNARLALGLYAAYGHATQHFTPRAGTGTADGASDQIGLGLYAAWLHNAGWFANITLAAACYDNDFTSHDQSGNRTVADYNDNAIGASLEFGKRIALDRAIAPSWFLEPTAQVTLAQLLRDDYHTTGNTNTNHLDIRASDATITRLRATLRAGRTWREIELSARIGTSHETSSGGKITITNTAAAPWRPTTVGQLYFDYEFATGDAYQKPWSFSLGYRHAF